MRSFILIALGALLSGCGYKGPLYVPAPKAAATKPDAAAPAEPAPSRPVPAESAPPPK